jgi:hypothetical protein
VDGQAKAAADFFREGLHFFGLDPFAPGHAERQADHDLGYAVLADDLLQMGKIKAFILPLEGFQPLRRDAQGIGNGEADPPRTNI